MNRATRFLVFLPVALLAWFSPVKASASNLLINGSFSLGGGGWSGSISPSCSGGLPSIGGAFSNALTFSYIPNTVSQSVVVPRASTVVFSYYAQIRSEDWGSGQVEATISDSDEQMTSGSFSPEKEAQQYALAITTESPNEVVTVSLTGSDAGLFWAGCYGPIVTSAGLYATPVIQPIPSNSVWVEIPENGMQIVEAPEGSVFVDVLFASYGTPNGSQGEYTQGWCHSPVSDEKVREMVIGRQSAEIYSNNGVFGDPCGGTYKSLFVLLEYSLPATTTTSTTTTSTTTTSTSSTTTTSTTTTTIPVQVEQITTTVVETTPQTSTTVTTVPVTTTTRVVPNATTTTQAALPEPTPIPQDEEETPPQTPLEEMNQQQIIAEVNKIIDDGITSDKAEELATNPQVVASLTGEQAAAVFASLDISQLTEEEAEKIVAAVQNAPESVRKALEKEINIYGGKFDSYIPTGSAISVSERRVVVAAAAVLAAAPVAATTRKM